MDQLHQAQIQINELLLSIKGFIEEESDEAIYKTPIIDWHHPNSYGYKQSNIIGLKKFQISVENELNYIESILNSITKIQIKEFSSNLPNLLAIWDQVKFATWPIISISTLLDLGSGKDKSQVKIDLVEDGGASWVKVNTIKESRLMAEFREHDSYLNSDYESDSSSISNQAGPSRPRRPSLSNSLIAQATSLVRAAEQYPRLDGFPAPKVKYVLNRLEENPEGGYSDPRVQQTFQAIRDLGVELILGSDEREIPKRPTRKPLVPTKKILLDLSVLVALCCDSSHLELPKSTKELESRFRNLQLSKDGKTLELAEHIPVTKDLKDQLEWEMKHPLIQELLDRLTPICKNGEEVEFWVTAEVQNKLPTIVDIIGGEDEKRRAKILFDGDGQDDFWKGSRWKGKVNILEHIKINVLSSDENGSLCSPDKANTAFKKGFITIVNKMLNIVEIQSKQTPEEKLELEKQKSKFKKYKDTKRRRSKIITNQPSISIESKLPSEHTLRTFLVGLNNDWTILTNNRGAVGKVLRELKIDQGLGYPITNKVEKVEEEENEEENEKTEKINIWVVNPSSLSEWRRKQVENNNKKLLEYSSNPKNEKTYEDWLMDGLHVDEGVMINEQGNGWKKGGNVGSG